MCAVLGHRKRLRLGKDQRPDGRRNRCRVSGSSDFPAQFVQFAGKGDRRCGQGLSTRAKGFPRMSLLPAGWFIRPALHSKLPLRVRGGFLLSPSALDGKLFFLFRTVRPQAALNSTTRATSAAFSWRIVAFCAASAAAFAGEHRILCDKSLNACLPQGIATRTSLSPVASAGCSGTRRRDSVVVTLPHECV